ncbi:FkbM family methyltransferase [Shimia sp. R9_3]|nr:FkbM family methyltransferase [Shimia sp. R9_3]
MLASIDVQLVRKSKYEQLLENRKKYRDIELASVLDIKMVERYLEFLPFSTSQLRQDLFVLSELGFKTNGYFVEFGATDGVTLSNSFLLESKFNWTGILAEPAKTWHDQLIKNRNVNIERDCVWRASNEKLIFNEVQDAQHNGELSTIDSFSSSDKHKTARQMGKKYEVDTISLMDLLKKYNAPKKIDYLSIDTEGSEFEILNSFDFSEYSFKVITCEHNFTPMRDEIHNLLSSHGYVRKFTEFSRFDDWYVLQDN